MFKWWYCYYQLGITQDFFYSVELFLYPQYSPISVKNGFYKDKKMLLFTFYLNIVVQWFQVNWLSSIQQILLSVKEQCNKIEF